MKTFFGSVFMKKEDLKEAGIDYPIKVEYYKRINEDEIIKKNNPRYGISVVKTEYIQDNIKIEHKEIPYITNDESKIDKILKIFKENEVTPIVAEEIICDFWKR